MYTGESKWRVRQRSIYNTFYYVHFETNTLRKGMNLFILSPTHGLNDTPIVVLQR